MLFLLLLQLLKVLIFCTFNLRPFLNLSSRTAYLLLVVLLLSRKILQPILDGLLLDICQLYSLLVGHLGVRL